DGNPNTRFDTRTSQTPGMWFLIELQQQTTLTGLELDAAKSPRDYPRGYKVELSSDGKAWDQPVAVGKGENPVTDIFFPPTPARFVRITETGAVNGLFWSIHELELFEAAPPR